MNRHKLWAYVAVVLCVGAGSLFYVSRWVTHRSVGQLDRELKFGASQVDARVRLLASEATLLAEAVARDPGFVQAISNEGQGNPGSAARTALDAALRGTADPSRPLLLAIVARGARTFRTGDTPVSVDPRAESFVAEVASDRVRKESFLVAGDALHLVVAVPAGRDASVAVGMPIAGSWLPQVRLATGCDVTLLAGNLAPKSTLEAKEATYIASVARGVPGVPFSTGSLRAQGPKLSLPLLFAKASAYRVQLVALKGPVQGTLVLSLPAAPLLGSVAGYVWIGLIILALMVAGGVVLGLTMTEEGRAAQLPRELTAAADRIARGDFSARAPILVGSLSTISEALNRAVTAAEVAAAGKAGVAAEGAAEGELASPTASVTQPVLQGGEAEPEVPPPPPMEEEGREPQPPLAEEAEGREPLTGEAVGEAVEGQEPLTGEVLEGREPLTGEVLEGREPLTGEVLGGREPSAGEPSTAEAEVREPLPGEVEGREPLTGFPEIPREVPPVAAASTDPFAPRLGGEPPAAEPDEVLRAASNVAARGGIRPGVDSDVFTPYPGFEAHREKPAATFESLPVAASGSFPAPAPMTDRALVADPLAEAALPPRKTEIFAPPATFPAAPRPPMPEAIEAPAPAPVPTSDEDHWRAVHGDFVRVRIECGESGTNVPYERFREKLEKNRDQLMAKYNCRTVRFQVYVKEGKAALKASPIR